MFWIVILYQLCLFKAFPPKIYGFYLHSFDAVFIFSSADQEILILMKHNLSNVYFMDHCFYIGNCDSFSLLGL